MLALFFRWVSLVYHTSHFVILATYYHNIGSHSFDYIWNLTCHSYKKFPCTPWTSKWLHFGWIPCFIFVLTKELFYSILVLKSHLHSSVHSSPFPRGLTLGRYPCAIKFPRNSSKLLGSIWNCLLVITKKTFF